MAAATASPLGVPDSVKEVTLEQTYIKFQLITRNTVINRPPEPQKSLVVYTNVTQEANVCYLLALASVS